MEIEYILSQTTNSFFGINFRINKIKIPHEKKRHIKNKSILIEPTK